MIIRSANLAFNEDGQERVRNTVSSNQDSDNQHRAHGEEGISLDEHGGNCLAQSTDSGWRSRGNPDVPATQDKLNDDRERGGNEDIERSRN